MHECNFGLLTPLRSLSRSMMEFGGNWSISSRQLPHSDPTELAEDECGTFNSTEAQLPASLPHGQSTPCECDCMTNARGAALHQRMMYIYSGSRDTLLHRERSQFALQSLPSLDFPISTRHPSLFSLLVEVILIEILRPIGVIIKATCMKVVREVDAWLYKSAEKHIHDDILDVLLDVERTRRGSPTIQVLKERQVRRSPVTKSESDG